jgi:hypothetical protein
MNIEEVKGYIGEKEIKGVIESDETKFVHIVFQDDTTENMTQLLFTASKSDQPIDASDLRDKQCRAVALEMMKIMHAYDITLGNVQYTTSLVLTTITELEKQGDIKKWGTERYKVKFSELDKVLKDE